MKAQISKKQKSKIKNLFRMKKTLLLLTITFSLILSQTAFASNIVTTFPSDIKNHWSETFVTSLVNKGIISGYPDGTFKPDREITSSEFLSLLIKAMNESVREKTTDEAWDMPIREKAVALGIIKPNDEFALTNKSLTREETAYLLFNALSRKENFVYDIGYTYILDVAIFDADKISPQYKESVYSMLQKGVLTQDKSYFNPKQAFTRGASCVVIERVMDKSKRVDASYEILDNPDARARFRARNLGFPYTTGTKLSNTPKQVPFQDGKPVMDKNSIISELKKHRSNVGISSLNDFYWYDEALTVLPWYRNPSYEEKKKIVDGMYDAAVNVMKNHYNYSYLDDLTEFEKNYRFYLSTVGMNNTRTNNTLNNIKENTLVLESHFITDKSLFYVTSNSRDRTRGRLYFIYKSPSQKAVFNTRTIPDDWSKDIELKVNQWYYVDVEVDTAEYMPGDGDWEYNKYAFGGLYYLSDFIPINPLNQE